MGALSYTEFFLFLKTGVGELSPARTFFPSVPGSSENEPIEKCVSVLGDIKQSAWSYMNSEAALASNALNPKCPLFVV